jgi:hypothetical protein
MRRGQIDNVPFHRVLSPGKVGSEMPTSPDDPDPETTLLVYEQVNAAVDAQFQQIASLNERALQLLGFAGVVISIVVGLGAEKDTLRAALLGVGVVIFAVTAAYGLEAWRIYGWRRDPRPRALWGRYRLWGADWLRQQMILNLIQSFEHNERAIDQKVKLIKRTQKWLAVEIAYLTSLMIALPFLP